MLDSYDSKEVVLTWWDEKPIEIHENELQLPQFELVDYVPETCIEAYKTGQSLTFTHFTLLAMHLVRAHNSAQVNQVLSLLLDKCNVFSAQSAVAVSGTCERMD